MRKGISDVWKKNHQNMGPWGNVHPAEGISAKNPFREAGFGPAIVSRDKWRSQVFILVTAGKGKILIFSNFKKKFPQMH